MTYLKRDTLILLSKVPSRAQACRPRPTVARWKTLFAVHRTKKWPHCWGHNSKRGNWAGSLGRTMPDAAPAEKAAWFEGSRMGQEGQPHIFVRPLFLRV